MKISEREQCKFLIAVLFALLCASGLGAQTFNSGSNGSDGALDLTAQSGTIVFNPASFTPPLDPDGDSIYHFTTITIPSGLTLRFPAETLGVKPIIWLASGEVRIEGILDLDGGPGHSVAGPRIPPSAGAGGYQGGLGGTDTEAVQPGRGPGGAPQAGGGAGYSSLGGGPSGAGGPVYGNPFLIPLVGGSGGAGGSFAPSVPGNRFGAGGGSGGGAILIASSSSMNIHGGTIRANGGVGTCNSGEGTAPQSSGGGSGGAIRLMAVNISGSTTILANGGTSCNGGGVGSKGRIRLEAFNLSLTGAISPSPATAPPGLVFPPASAPVIRIVSIGGTAVPASPTGSFVMPDVTLDNATTVTIQLEGSKVPVGTIVKVTLTPETGPIQTVDSTPLAGTFESSIATATVTLPHGFSRFSVQASWTP